MSTLKADTIQSTSGGAATLTKQEATKFWVTYDAVSQATRGSLNQSSLTDETTGRFHSSFTNAFSSSTDKCAVTDCYNSDNDTGNHTGASRGGNSTNVGTSTNGTFRALSASEIQYFCNFNANASSDGSADEFKAHYVMVVGDLA